MSGRRVTTVYPHTDRARVRIEAPCEWINANHRYAHWAVKAKRTSAWRQAAAAYARRITWRRTQLQFATPVHITAVMHMPTARSYDAPNLYPTVKACIDGLVDAGLLPDDSNTYVRGLEMRAGEKAKPSYLELIIESADDGGTA